MVNRVSKDEKPLVYVVSYQDKVQVFSCIMDTDPLVIYCMNNHIDVSITITRLQ